MGLFWQFAQLVYLCVYPNGNTMKKKNKNQKPSVKLTDFVFSGHCEEQLIARFNIATDVVMDMGNFFKKGSTSCNHSQVRNKIVSYPHQVVFYNERYNLMLTCDTITKKITTAMYLQPNK